MLLLRRELASKLGSELGIEFGSELGKEVEREPKTLQARRAVEAGTRSGGCP